MENKIMKWLSIINKSNCFRMRKLPRYRHFTKWKNKDKSLKDSNKLLKRFKPIRKWECKRANTWIKNYQLREFKETIEDILIKSKAEKL